ncbi:MAG: AAA family ATPase, partial [Blautia producta]|nr:AAA family ATPase [Blautia producta]
MKVISFLNPKGGSGKTTVTINVSTSIAKKHRVA